MTKPVAVDETILCESTTCAICGRQEAVPFSSGYDYQYWTSRQKFKLVQCAHCSHVYLNPRPRLENASEIYPKDYYTLTGRHTQKSSKLIAFMKKRVILNRLSLIRNRLNESINILEIGCGDCSLLIDLKTNFPSVNITGIDLAISDQAKQRCHDHDIPLIEGSIEDISLPAEKYDLVIMNQVIEHLWAPSQALSNIRQSLKPGGVISIETVNISAYDRKLFPSGKWGAYYFPRHLNLFSFQTLRQLLEKNGFSVIKQYPLLGVINWAFSFKALFCPTPQSDKNVFARFFSDRNPLCLAIFTIVDLVGIALGLITSNQKTFARRN